MSHGESRRLLSPASPSDFPRFHAARSALTRSATQCCSSAGFEPWPIRPKNVYSGSGIVLAARGSSARARARRHAAGAASAQGRHPAPLPCPSARLQLGGHIARLPVPPVTGPELRRQARRWFGSIVVVRNDCPSWAAGQAGGDQAAHARTTHGRAVGCGRRFVLRGQAGSVVSSDRGTATERR